MPILNLYCNKCLYIQLNIDKEYKRFFTIQWLLKSVCIA